MRDNKLWPRTLGAGLKPLNPPARPEWLGDEQPRRSRLLLEAFVDPGKLERLHQDFPQEGAVKAFRINPADLFDAAQVVIDGRPLRACRIVCARCGATDVARINTQRYSNDRDADKRDDRQASRKFKAMGWKIGADPGRHRCPKCLESETPAAPPLQKPPARKEKPMGATVTNLPNANAPKEMSIEDRRVIFEKLNEVYVDKDAGYADDWTDKTVAKDLGVPPAWVTQVRDQFFGPVASNPKIDEQMAQAATLAEELKKTAAALLTVAGDIEGRLADIQKRVRP
jgi:hypothetical protein